MTLQCKGECRDRGGPLDIFTTGKKGKYCPLINPEDAGLK